MESVVSSCFEKSHKNFIDIVNSDDFSDFKFSPRQKEILISTMDFLSYLPSYSDLWKIKMVFPDLKLYPEISWKEWTLLEAFRLFLTIWKNWWDQLSLSWYWLPAIHSVTSEELYSIIENDKSWEKIRKDARKYLNLLMLDLSVLTKSIKLSIWLPVIDNLI